MTFESPCDYFTTGAAAGLRVWGSGLSGFRVQVDQGQGLRSPSGFVLLAAPPGVSPGLLIWPLPSPLAPLSVPPTGRTKASTLSLSVLVAIEMFNAFNALSEDNSLLSLPPWSNPWLMVATVISLGLHCVILYIPFLAQVCACVFLCERDCERDAPNERDTV